MEPSFLEDAESVDLYIKAKAFLADGYHVKALEIIGDFILSHREDKASFFLYIEQGNIFLNLAQRTEDTDLGFAYMLASVECFSVDVQLSRLYALELFNLAQHLGSVLYYKKCVDIATQGLSVTYAENTESVAPMSLLEPQNEKQNFLKSLIKDAESKIAVSKTCSIKYCEPKVLESKISPDAVTDDKYKELRSYWVGLDVNIKRDFVKVSIEELNFFVEECIPKRYEMLWKKFLLLLGKTESELHVRESSLVLKNVRIILNKNMLQILNLLRKRIGKEWTRKISVGGWKPLDAVAAVEMIKDQLAYVKDFAPKSKNGWSLEWSLVVDEERSKLLKEIKLLLVTFCYHKILSCSIRDWVMRFPVRHLGKLQVSEQSLIDSRIVETPQSICFLECQELNQILDFLKNIKCERHDGTNVVCSAVDNFLCRTRVNEMMDFDPQYSLLLLDKRLLKSNNAPFDDEGTINTFDPSVHYAKAPAQGDDIISWLADYSSVDKMFPRPIREYNLDIWVAVMKAVQFTARTLGTKYAKKVQVLAYEAALTLVETVCMSEDEKRINLQEDQWNIYASVLCNRCEARVHKNSPSTKPFLCAVRDILEGASHPTFDFPDIENCLNLIREHKSPSDDRVLASIHLLKSVVTKKVLLIDSKILLIDNSRIRLLNNLTRLSVFDNRTYMLRLLKPFLLIEIVNMESKVKSDAAEAELLHEEEKKSQTKKKNNKRNKRTSTSMSSPLDKTVELEPSSNLEPEDTLASDNQEEATKVDSDMQNMPGGHSLWEHLEAALGRALDMTLKALLNIGVLKEDLKQNEQPFQDDLEEQVPLALQKIFTAFKSDVIEGVYSFLLSDLLAWLKEVISMPSDAAEVLVTILEYSHCWKKSERESLVTRLFALEENERMSCRKCRRKPNYLEQSYNGIVMAADSIRDLKDVGNWKSVVRFCEEKKVRPEILFYEAARSMV